MPLRSFLRLGSAAPACGCVRAGPVSVLPVTEKATLGFPPPLRSLSCLASLLPVSDILQPGLPILSRQLSRAEAVLLAFGMCRLGPLFVLFVVSSASPGPSLLLRSSARAGLSPAAPQMTHSESSLSSRSFAYPGLLALPCCVSRPEVSILVPGKCDTESALFLQSSSYADLVVFVPASSHVDSTPSLRQMAGSGSTVLLSGLFMGWLHLLPAGGRVQPPRKCPFLAKLLKGRSILTRLRILPSRSFPVPSRALTSRLFRSGVQLRSARAFASCSG